MSPLDALATVLVPPLCPACGRHCDRRATVCEECLRRLRETRPLSGPGPAGVDRAWAAAAHKDVAREMVVALKYARLPAVAEAIAAHIHARLPTPLRGGAIVPAPSAALRSRLRGFEPAGEIAAALARRSGAPLRAGCLRRAGLGRQVGRGRADRIGRPPRIEAREAAPASVLLLDDVQTTGATITACAAALRGAGAKRVVAITFSRRP